MGCIMKKHIILLFVCCTALFVSCFKDNDKDFYFKDFRVEFQDAVLNNNAIDKDFPVIDSKVGLNSYQVNLLGGLKNESFDVAVKVLKEESTAVEGVDYKFKDGEKIIFQDEKAISHLEIEVLNSSRSEDLLLVVELQPSESIKVNKNFKTIGVKIKK